MDLSIIIPCHNLEPFISKLLYSLSNQLIDGIEVETIFVLDNCTDNTKEKIAEWSQSSGARLHPQIHEIHANACGIARNKGLDLCSGEFIWFMDGDDWLLRDDALKIALQMIKMCSAPFVRFEYLAPQFQAHGHPSMVWQYIFRATSLSDMRFSNIQPHEDRDFMEEYMKKYGYPPYYDIPLYHYNYMREGSNMYQFQEKGFIEP